MGPFWGRQDSAGRPYVGPMNFAIWERPSFPDMGIPMSRDRLIFNMGIHPFTGKGAVTCAVCPESAWLVTFLIGNVSTGVVTWSALRCGASGESGKKVAAAPLSKTAAAAAAAKTWFVQHPLDYMLHNRFPWKRSGRRSSMWPPYSLRRNLSAAACRPCDRSFRRHLYIETAPADNTGTPEACDKAVIRQRQPGSGRKTGQQAFWGLYSFENSIIFQDLHPQNQINFVGYWTYFQ